MARDPHLFCHQQKGPAMRTIPTDFMLQYLGHEVNVILHDGTSYWRKLIGVFPDTIILTPKPRVEKLIHDAKYNRLIPQRYHILRIDQKDIRSFGTREDGILVEVSE